MKSDEDYFSRNMTHFNVFLRILRLGENTRILPYFITGLNVRNNYAPFCGNPMGLTGAVGLSCSSHSRNPPVSQLYE